MVEALIALNILGLWITANTIHTLLGRFVAVFFFVYIGVFCVIKPALMYYLEMVYPYSYGDQSAISRVLFGSLLFLLTNTVCLKWIAKKKPPALLTSVFDFSRFSSRAICLLYFCFALISFVGCVLRFKTVTYLWADVNSFEGIRDLADGAYYINFLADILLYAMIAAIAYQNGRFSKLHSFAIVVTLLAFTFFWTKIGTRTGILITLMTWASCVFTRVEQRRVNLLKIALFGYVLLIGNYVLNRLRLGLGGTIELDVALLGAALAFLSDTVPVDNAALLYTEMYKFPMLYFQKLIGALLPTVMIPSSIFPFKIPADKDAELTRMFFPDGADTSYFYEGSTLTFTIPASGYADAGFIGVIVASIVYGFLLSLLVSIASRGNQSVRFIGTFHVFGLIVGYRLSVESLIIFIYTAFAFFALAKIVAAGSHLAFGKYERKRVA